LLPRNQRTPVHVNNLENILINWQGSGKHASWLIVQSAFWNDIPSATQEAAKEAIFNCLINSEVDYYSKYRLLHHLVRLRGGTTSRFRYIDRLSDQEKESLRTLMPNLLREAAFELNIIGLYTLKVLGATGNELKEYVNQYIPKPVGEPIKNALSYIAEPVLLSDDELDIAIEEEPDIFPQPY
jgi:hypothetical protein